jgi:RNA 2',3'-cyclic 3'-phosphodiesterase
MQTWRLFAAVPLPPAVQRLIGDIQDELEPEDWPFRWVEPELSHITLKFYGDTPVRRIQDLGKKLAWAAARTEPVTLKTGQMGAFPSTRRPRIVWLGLDGDLVNLERLAEDVDEVSTELGFSREERRFRAHITIGRLRNRMDPPEEFEPIVADLGLPAVDLPVDRLQLIRSVLGPEGPEYSVVDVWRLGEGSNAPRSLEHG